MTRLSYGTAICRSVPGCHHIYGMCTRKHVLGRCDARPAVTSAATPHLSTGGSLFFSLTAVSGGLTSTYCGVPCHGFRTRSFDLPAGSPLTAGMPTSPLLDTGLWVLVLPTATSAYYSSVSPFRLARSNSGGIIEVYFLASPTTHGARIGYPMNRRYSDRPPILEELSTVLFR